MPFIENLSAWDSQLFDRFGNVVHSRLNDWLIGHPMIHWMFDRPLISAIAIFITIILLVRLFLTIYRTVATTIDRMWLWVLSLPWLLLKFFFGWEAKPKSTPSSTTIANYEVTSDSQQIQDILTRLEQIQQQQQIIIQDIALLKQSSQLKNVDLYLANEKLPPASDR